MKRPTIQTVREMASLCTELRPDDGLPPQLYDRRFKPQQRGPNPARAQQYCKAVHHALDAGLAGACADPRLKTMTVQSVEPLPGGSKLLVIVTAPAPDQQAVVELEQILQRASGLLRSIIAGEIRRRRTPHLTFRVLPTAD